MSELSDAMDKAEAVAAKQDTVEASMETLLTATSAQIADLKSQIANIPGVDPALVARAQALADHLSSTTDKWSAAVLANTPAQPTP